MQSASILDAFCYSRNKRSSQKVKRQSYYRMEKYCLGIEKRLCIFSLLQTTFHRNLDDW